MLKHITIILPFPYRGGSLRVTKTIARMIRAGSQRAGEPCKVRIGVLAGVYDLAANFTDALEDGVDIVEFEWSDVSPEAIHIANANQGRTVDLPFDIYQMPIDGIKNFADSDLWLVVSDRTNKPLAPIRPYVVFATDYIQRYVPEIFEGNASGSYDLPFLQTVRQASAVITTTPQTAEDVISYVGVPRTRVHLAPMDFDPTPLSGKAPSKKKGEGYFVWPTNTTKHKNHLRAFDALMEYYDLLGGKLRLKVMGPFSDYMNPDNEDAPDWFRNIPYIQEIQKKIRSSSSIRRNVEFVGELSDAAYAATVTGAAFLWHPTIYDNGTFAVAEAAWLGTPSLSSGYPQMRYIGERFAIPIEFFNARSAPKMAASLKAMERAAGPLRAKLPSREALSKHTWQHYASDYWRMLKGISA
ncbi:glycosyltransferase [Mesorhizobium sp. BR1-1-6]|uniref:glycosyltransferase family 4 protein n=1 Tax=unclassified Mesorhizobium TaxID=325217 RepID=UPI00112D101C|nr:MULTISPECIES: glycosyltransferase family 4 protein [unclassified Mesorhizobium]MBZ9896623.1 glycosyltransferase [Mesorhizobium sp. BR1-1-6]MBZ9921389.1 glycosyltransferase [Mesorhizobium sp. BR1-1-7]MBZ9970366.1 glycosyltransferase [Mesorhizobium sp. BR1-1-12]MBZ9981306.1 glycosyltransferase [Mesorhizobium sp. BR-1-1-8]TPL33701.1 glycosyltransferase family 4 protein [Mesorhizobium sp. B2-4-8]